MISRMLNQLSIQLILYHLYLSLDQYEENTVITSKLFANKARAAFKWDSRLSKKSDSARQSAERADHVSDSIFCFLELVFNIMVNYF